MKSKRTAAILAFFLGAFGTHRFYLGQRVLAFAMIALTAITVIMSIELDGPVVFVAMIAAFVDAVLFSVMPKEEFDAKYNAKYMHSRRPYFNDIEEKEWSYKNEEPLEEPEQEPAYNITPLAAMPKTENAAAVKNEEKLSLELDLLEQIAQYGRLKEQGLLTEDEFEQLKRRIL